MLLLTAQLKALITLVVLLYSTQGIAADIGTFDVINLSGKSAPYPLLFIEEEGPDRPTVLIVGGFGDNIESFRALRLHLRTLNFNIAYLAQRTEDPRYEGLQLPQLVSDLDSALWRISEKFPETRITILGQSMAWGTIEGWRHLIFKDRFHSSQFVERVIYSNPVINFDGFLLSKDLENLFHRDPTTKMGIFFRVPREGSVRLVQMGEKPVALIRKFRNWLEHIRNADLYMSTPIPTTFLISLQDIQLDTVGIFRYIHRMGLVGIPVDVGYVQEKNPFLAHNFWRSREKNPQSLRASTLTSLAQALVLLDLKLQSSQEPPKSPATPTPGRATVIPVSNPARPGSGNNFPTPRSPTQNRCKKVTWRLGER